MERRQSKKVMAKERRPYVFGVPRLENGQRIYWKTRAGNVRVRDARMTTIARREEIDSCRNADSPASGEWRRTQGWIYLIIKINISTLIKTSLGNKDQAPLLLRT